MSSAKKMSLEEFLKNDDLGDTMWNEDDINLDAINNNISIDILKNARTNMQNSHQGHLGGGGRDHRHFDNYPSKYQAPYIVKFSNLPPDFTDYEITDLFKSKMTTYVKFKIFWELNSHPTIEQLTNKNESKFDLNFLLSSKVAFVELYSSRDLEKILLSWRDPLQDLYKIMVTLANFTDFQNYLEKNNLIQNVPHPPPGKALPKKNEPSKPKPSPFGAAKPVDTQSKILEIEEQVTNLHIEDTTTLRRLSNENSKPKVVILKKEVAAKVPVAIPAKKPLDYGNVVKKANRVEEPSSSTQNALSSTYSMKTSKHLPKTYSEAVDDKEKTEAENTQNISSEQKPLDSADIKGQDDKQEENFNKQELDEELENAENQDTDGFQGHNRFNSRRGQYSGSRGGAYQNRTPGRGSNRGGRGGNRGNYNNYNNNNSNYKSANANVSSGSQQTASGNDERYSMFRPASGFLQSDGDRNYKKGNNRGGFDTAGGGNTRNNRGSFRGGSHTRGRGKFRGSSSHRGRRDEHAD